MSDWSVIAIVKEPWPVLERFLSWHLNAGASAIHLVFDDPDDPLLDIVSGFHQVKAYRGTEDFWRMCGALGSRTFTSRQNRAMKYLYTQVQSDWVLNVDGDELLATYGKPVSELLREQPAEVRSILIRVAEHVGQDKQTGLHQFRRPHRLRQTKRIYGAFAPFLMENLGLVGHRIGKSICRSGLDLARFHPHWPVGVEQKRIIDRTLGPTSGVEVLHFYARGYDGWRAKLRYRIAAQARGRRDLILDELRQLVEAQDEAGLKTMYEKMHTLDDRQTSMMRKRDLLAEVDITYPSLTVSGVRFEDLAHKAVGVAADL